METSPTNLHEEVTDLRRRVRDLEQGLPPAYDFRAELELMQTWYVSAVERLKEAQEHIRLLSAENGLLRRRLVHAAEPPPSVDFADEDTEVDYTFEDKVYLEPV